MTRRSDNAANMQVRMSQVPGGIRQERQEDATDTEQKLEDLLRPGLRLVICGTAAGTQSAAINAYYAGPANRFWQSWPRPT